MSKEKSSANLKVAQTSGWLVWATVTAGLAFSAFYPIYSWIPRVTIGLMWVQNLMMVVSSIVFVLAILAVAANDGSLASEKNKEKLSAEKRVEALEKLESNLKKQKGVFRTLRLCFFILVYLVCGFAAGFYFTTIVSFILSVLTHFLMLGSLQTVVNACRKDLRYDGITVTPKTIVVE